MVAQIGSPLIRSRPQRGYGFAASARAARARTCARTAADAYA